MTERRHRIIEATRYFVEGHDAVFATREGAEQHARIVDFNAQFPHGLQFIDATVFLVWLNENRDKVATLMGWEIHDAK